jgi:hypothetical protein
VEDEAIEEVLLMDDSRPDALDNFIESVDLPQE